MIVSQESLPWGIDVQLPGTQWDLAIRSSGFHERNSFLKNAATLSDSSFCIHTSRILNQLDLKPLFVRHLHSCWRLFGKKGYYSHHIGFIALMSTNSNMFPRWLAIYYLFDAIARGSKLVFELWDDPDSCLAPENSEIKRSSCTSSRAKLCQV